MSSSYVPITNTDNSEEEHKTCLYESKIYPGLMIPCPTSRYRVPPYRHQENEDVYDQVEEVPHGENEETDDKGAEYDYPENQNQEDYPEEIQQPPNADEQFEHLVHRVKCKKAGCHHEYNNDYENENEEDENQENANQENENEEHENQDNVNQENENQEEESEEESPDYKEENSKPLPKPKPKPKPKPTPKPQGIDPKLKPLTVIHNYQPANFTKITVKKNNLESDEDKDNIEDDEDDESSQESRFEDVEEYNQGDELQDDEYYYDNDDEDDYEQKPKKPKIPQKLTNIDDMKFKSEGDEPSESVYKNTVLKNVSKTEETPKSQISESTNINSTPQRPKPFDSAAEAYTRVKDKNKPQDQQTMQMAIHETTVALNLIDEQKYKYKLPTKTDSTTVSAKYRPRPTIRPNILKR